MTACARTRDETIEAVAKKFESGNHGLATIAARDALMADPDLLGLVLGGAVRCLGATRSHYDKATKDYVSELDGPTVMRAVALLLAYRDGMPAQTTVNLTVGAAKGAELSVEEAMQASPALREKLRQMLQKAEGEASRPAIEVGGK
jgi:hypothetical protein